MMLATKHLVVKKQVGKVVKYDQRLAVLLVVALLICLVHAMQLKHRKKGAAVGPEMSFVWFNGAAPAAIYSLPASGMSYTKLLVALGVKQDGRAVLGEFRPKNRNSYIVSSDGELLKVKGAYQAAPFFYLPIPLNKTDATTLKTIAGIGETLSRRIINYRDKHGSYTSIEDLLSVEGVGEKKLQKMRSSLTIE